MQNFPQNIIQTDSVRVVTPTQQIDITTLLSQGGIAVSTILAVAILISVLLGRLNQMVKLLLFVSFKSKSRSNNNHP